MKNSYLTIVFIIGTIFCIKVSASDTLSVNTSIPALAIADISGDSILKSEHKVLNDSNKVIPMTNKSKRLVRKGENGIVIQNGTTLSENPDSNPLLTYIQNYDIHANKAYLRPAREITSEDLLDDLEMTPLLMPLVFNAIHREFKVFPQPRTEPDCEIHSPYLDSVRIKDELNMYTRGLNKAILIDAESRQINQIKYDQKTLPQPEKMIFYLNTHKQSPWMRSPGTLSGRNSDTKELPRTEYDPWTKSVNMKLQFSQTYNSPNWSKGGESNMAGLTTIYMNANYSNLRNIQFDNNMEAKIGLNTVSSDTLRNLNISTDQLRATSKLGVRMHNDFYYSLSGEFTTQFLNNYKSNTMTLQSSFMSPAKLFVGLGVDYKKSDRKKGYNLSLLLTPLTCKMNYLYDNVNLNPTSFGIDEGRHFKSELGSKLTATLTWKLSEQAQWKSNFYYYTDFTYVDSDWENTLDLNFNNYFATSIYVHLKLDDRLKRDPGESLIQMQELFSFGMVYHW